MSSSGKTHTLTIRNVQLSDFGNYSCVVVNSIGREKKYIELSGKPGPPIVTSSGYSNPHQYNLTWVVQSVFPIVEVRILYRRMLVSVSFTHQRNLIGLLADKLDVSPSGAVARPPGASTASLQPFDERETPMVPHHEFSGGICLRVSGADEEPTRFRGTFRSPPVVQFGKGETFAQRCHEEHWCFAHFRCFSPKLSLLQ